MTDSHGMVRIGLLSLGAPAVLTMLVVFYSIVSGAVDRASQRRAESADNARLSIAAGTLTVAPKFARLTTASR